METTFKIAQISDIEILLPLVRDFYEYDGHHFNEGVVRTALTEFLNDASLGQVWFILTGETVVGYMVLTLGYSLSFGGRDAFVDEIFIRENQRGRGIGRQAFAFLETWGRQHGLKAIHLEVERVNSRARAVYQALGFAEQEQYLMTCWPGETSARYHFKTADLADFDTLLPLMQEQGIFNDEHSSRVGMKALLGNNNLGNVWLLQNEAGVCGYLVITYSYSLEFHGRDALLDQLYVRQGCQQSDLFLGAIQFARDMAGSMGAHALHIRIKRNEFKVQAAYRAAGFEDDDSYLMTKWIHP